MGLVFLIGFIYFLVNVNSTKNDQTHDHSVPAKRRFYQLVHGKSGLVPENISWGHVELTTHFIVALGLLLLYPLVRPEPVGKNEQRIINPASKNFLFPDSCCPCRSMLICGGFMAGLRAPSRRLPGPTLTGMFLPVYNELSPFGEKPAEQPGRQSISFTGVWQPTCFLYHPCLVDPFTGHSGRPFITRLRSALLLTVLPQVVLGILTVLNATHANRPRGIGRCAPGFGDVPSHDPCFVAVPGPERQ